MISSRHHQPGFTLFEIVAVLVVIGLGLAFGAMMFTSITNNNFASKDAVEDGQKVQAAMNRLVKELTYAGRETVVVTGNRSIQWTSQHPERLGEVSSASWNGNPGSGLTLNGTPLLDRVELFLVSSTADSITVTLSSSGSPGLKHTTVVHSRYEN